MITNYSRNVVRQLATRQARLFTTGAGPKPIPQFFQGASSTPTNTILNFVPQQQQWVIERMGKYNRTVKEGPHFIIPIFEKIRSIHSVKESVLEIQPHNCITIDQKDLVIDGVAFIKVLDTFKATYNIDDVDFAINELCQTRMRTEIGNLKFDDVVKNRNELNEKIKDFINSASLENWGVECIRYEIKDISKI
ncbi:Uncharacterized protein C16G5.07c [Candida viswanathii]|uniref:Uncharacterized protein C16G5.07c n=1 Tax=Candida viswanathii TaxID=5486 RepID=A0A367YMJ0_9ASCO|nr:Uncharacterized protein C16G5.07c [Candida viswanathii]